MNIFWIVVLGVLSLLAFSKGTRIKMFRRDGGACRGCGRLWDDGWMLQGAHLDHTKNGNYDNVDNGVMLCVECHLLQHQRLFDEAQTEGERNFHAYAIRKLGETDPYNWMYYEKARG